MPNTRRANRKDRKSRSNRRRMNGGKRKESAKIARRLYGPISALGTGASKTLSTAAGSAINVFGTVVKGVDKTLKSAAGTINSTVSKVFTSRRRRNTRRH